ncbi:MAG: hypothetical protein HZC41_13160 [Chloroflexi bacterium]|nr:hypothetical protein [Chloroflexota bacterium]
MLRTFLVTIICLVGLAGSARAQETTPQPEQNYILSWTSEVIFPQAIRFSVVLSRPVAELAAVSLTVRPQGQTPAVVDLTLAQALVSQPYSELAYIWDIPSAAPPRLFSEIRFEWQATTRDGERARAEDRLMFSDKRVTWIQREADPINLTIPADGLAAPNNVLGRLQRELQPVYDLLAENTGRSPTFNLMVYPGVPAGCVSDERGEPVAIGPISGTVVACDRELAGRIYASSGYQVVQSGSPGYAAMQAALVDALVRGFYDWPSVPDWFAAGLATFHEPAPLPGALPRLMAAARSDRLYPLEIMTRQPGGVDDDLWRAQSYGMVIYIASRAGVPGLFRLAEQASAVEGFDAAYRSLMNRSVENLLTDWQQWLFSAEATNAFTITPYLAATPTPTPSRTPTATATPPPSDTPTPFPPTLTPTLLGFAPTLTPLPSATASRTPLPAAPTVTPRPPGSLFTPTPAVMPELAAPPAMMVGIAAVVLIVIAILALVFTGFRRR